MDLSMGQVRKLTGLSEKYLRDLDRRGVVRPRRTKNNYRWYSEQDMWQLFFVCQLRSFGFSMDEIVDLMSLDGPEVYERLDVQIDVLKRQQIEIGARIESIKDFQLFFEHIEDLSLLDMQRLLNRHPEVSWIFSFLGELHPEDRELFEHLRDSLTLQNRLVEIVTTNDDHAIEEIRDWMDSYESMEPANGVVLQLMDKLDECKKAGISPSSPTVREIVDSTYHSLLKEGADALSLMILGTSMASFGTVAPTSLIASLSENQIAQIDEFGQFVHEAISTYLSDKELSEEEECEINFFSTSISDLPAEPNSDLAASSDISND